MTLEEAKIWMAERGITEVKPIVDGADSDAARAAARIIRWQHQKNQLKIEDLRMAHAGITQPHCPDHRRFEYDCPECIEEAQRNKMTDISEMYGMGSDLRDGGPVAHLKLFR
jgi:hypothetical protein